MSEFKDLRVKDIELPQNKKMNLLIVFTLKDDVYSGLNERRQTRKWNDFKKDYGTKEKKNYVFSTDFELADNDPFKNKDVVVAIDLVSLAEIQPKDEKKLDFGLRILNDNHQIELTSSENGTDLNSGIDFKDIQEKYEENFKYLKNKAEEAKFKFEQSEKKANDEKPDQSIQRPQTQMKSPEEVLEEDEEFQDIQRQKQDDVSAEQMVTEDTTEEKTDNKRQQDSIQLKMSEQSFDYTNETKDDDSTLGSLKSKLFQTINHYIPDFYLNVNDFDKFNPEFETKEYKNLYKITNDGIKNRIISYNKFTQLNRQKLIHNIYRELEAKLVNRYFEILKLYKMDDTENIFNEAYRQNEDTLKQELGEVDRKTDQKERLLKQDFEQKKKNHLDLVFQKASMEYDEEHLPKIREEKEQFKEQLIQSINEKYDNELERIESEASETVDERLEKLVENVLEESINGIETIIQEFNESISEEHRKISEQFDLDWVRFTEQVKDIEAERHKNENLRQSKIDEEVSKRSKDYEEMRNILKNKENNITQLETQYNKILEENATKDRRITDMTNERTEYFESLKKAKEKTEDISKEYEELYAKYRDAIDPNNINAATQKQSEESNNSWWQKFDKYIIAISCAIILGICIVWASYNVKASDSQNSELQSKIEQQQKDVKAESEKQEKRNKELEEQAKQQKAKEEEQAKKDKEQQEAQKKLEEQQKKADEKSKDKKD
ncbi:hypothetical protein MXF31_02760 [Mammaliicoccus sciuri]|uniref:hypothetical protein n=1 Tax=Mammaliicoccus sciuri TaxID=1296 RepID=UPI002DBAEC3A|nr:hypothetical protein [Mammaliicoccus sciuri]MEB5648562.1 hypothetical protein [Mammaliicoccus sciuri]